MRSATIATACASPASVFRALPVSNTRTRGELGRDIQHGLALGEQPLRQWTPHPVCALDRPHVMRPLPMHVPAHQPVAGRISAESPLANT